MNVVSPGYRSSGIQLTRHIIWMAVLVLLAAIALVGAATPPPAHAANVTIDQCNGIAASAEGATTDMTCTVTVVNTINGSTTGSTVTVVRQCSLGPCPPGNGTFTTSSTDLVTQVTQCNSSGNDAAHPTVCNVIITNNISADTPGASPVSPATSNQCVGSAQGGGGSNTCDPFPATTTDATVTQCNGSANGGGGTIACTVDPLSMVSAAIPVRVNQCNGTGNPGGSTVTCRTSIATNIIPVAVAPSASATATPAAGTAASASPGAAAASPGTAAGAASATPRPAAGATPRPAAGTRPTAGATVRPTAGTTAGAGTGVPVPTDSSNNQVTSVPRGGVQAGGGSTAGGTTSQLAAFGAALLLLAVVLTRQLRLRTLEKSQRRSR